jgi:hypothetical protein
MITSEKLTIYFEDPFWVGIIERTSNNKLEVSKITFGAEPKDAEVYEFFLKNYYNLKFSPEIKAHKARKIKINPKKAQRDIKKMISKSGIGTKSQKALKLAQEENKTAKKIKSREQILAEKERKFRLWQEKRKQKHSGK